MPRESSIVRAILQAARGLGCYAEKRYGSVYGRTGDQDIFLLVPVSYQRYPIPVFIEVKQPGKQPTPLQEKRLRDRTRGGVPAIIAWSKDDVTGLIHALQGGTYAMETRAHHHLALGALPALRAAENPHWRL